MNSSNEIKEIALALSKVQSKLQPAKKDANNPFFKSTYADLNSVWDSCRELLSEFGLSVTQVNAPTENGVTVETVLMHTSGQWISGTMFLPVIEPNPQKFGSAMTYARRYGLAAIIGIVADEDDDGNTASGKTQVKQTPKMTGNQQEVIATMSKSSGMDTDKMTEFMKQTIGHANRSQLTQKEAGTIIEALRLLQTENNK